MRLDLFATVKAIPLSSFGTNNRKPIKTWLHDKEFCRYQGCRAQNKKQDWDSSKANFYPWQKCVVGAWTIIRGKLETEELLYCGIRNWQILVVVSTYKGWINMRYGMLLTENNNNSIVLCRECWICFGGDQLTLNLFFYSLNKKNNQINSSWILFGWIWFYIMGCYVMYIVTVLLEIPVACTWGLGV